MYDNIDLKLPRNEVARIDLLRHVPGHLTKVTSEGHNQYGPYCTGYLDNLKVTVSDMSVKIQDSSLGKYFLGNNFKTMTRQDTNMAIEKISDSLHLPIHRADVTRIDVAHNLIMKYNEKVYYPYLGELQYYTRLEQNNGLYYSNKKRQLLFYGKSHEQKLKGQPIPELYKNRNVLRYEMRYRKRLRQQFNRNGVKAGILYDEDFYYGLVERWQIEYLRIQKINSRLSHIEPTGSKKELIDYFASITILDLGQLNILNTIKEWQEKNQITKKQAFQLRNAIKQLTKISDSSESCKKLKDSYNESGCQRQNEMINELSWKIKEAASYC